MVLADRVVAPHLELLRRVCNPGSKSKPHITVRYFDKLRVPRDHLATQVRFVDLLEPGAFEPTDSRHRVVFIRCDADDLIGLEHKPHFPASEFHITLYEGDDTRFADALLKTLRRFRWMFRVTLPDGTRLKHVQLGRSRPAKVRGRPKLGDPVRKLFFEMTHRALTWSLIDGLTHGERLQAVRTICESLHSSTFGYARAVGTKGDSRRAEEHVEGEWEPAVHLTPPELAKGIAAYGASLIRPPDAPVHFGDPAVGNGAFYAALLQKVTKSRIATAVGVDISPRQVDAARARWEHRGLTVLRGDYLHLERLQPRTLILANPPYLRHQDIPAAYKRRLRERASVIMGTLIDAKAGQYVYFMILSHRWMSDGGVAVWLVPSGFMRARYGADLRRYLTGVVSLIRIHEFDAHDPQFENAKVLPAVVAFRKVTPRSGHRAILSVGGSLEAPRQSRSVAVSVLKGQVRWSAVEAQGGFGVVGVRVGDLFSVRRGIATGANDFFVLRREKALELELPEFALRPVLPKSRRLRSDVVERNEDGWPDVEPQLCVIDCELTEGEIAARSPALGRYLAGARERGVLERRLVRSRALWYRQEKRRPAVFLCTYMGRGNADRLPLRFIWNKSEAIATNAYLMMYPNERVARALGDRPGAKEEMFVLLKRAAVTTMTYQGRTYSGGLRKIEPRELQQLGLPEAPDWIRELAGNWETEGRLWPGS